MMLKITNDMEEIYKQDKAIVAFTATWCNPCKQMKPHFAKVAIMDNDTLYYVVDVDNIPPEYLEQLEIKSIPKIFEMNNGSIVRKIEGRTSSDILAELGLN